MLSLLVEQQNTHFTSMVATRLIIHVEKLQRVPSPSVLLDRDTSVRKDEETSL